MDELITEESLWLSHNYVENICTPSRTAFLSGRYPQRYGMQHDIIYGSDVFGLSLQESLISSEFQSQGYDTHVIGKWHVGYCSPDYTPLQRNFDTFYGFLLGGEYYFTHEYEDKTCSCEGYDQRNGNDVVPLDEHYNKYGPYLQRDFALNILSQYINNNDNDANDNENTKPFFMYLAWQLTHTPSESLPEVYDYYSSVNGETFPTEAIHHQAQVQTLDSLMNDVVTYLKSNGLWENTLLVFSSDNGALAAIGDNSPLRGYKKTSWEGAIRVPGFVTGGYLPESRRGVKLDNNIIHVTDWYPTLLSAAGLKVTYFNNDNDVLHPIDGVDMWEVIKGDSTDSNLLTREILLNIDPYECGLEMCGAIRYGKYKYILSDTTLETSDAYPETCFWGRQFSLSSDNDILGCGAAPESYLDYGYDDEDNIDENVNVIRCLTSNCAETGCLFDLSVDPCEYNDISAQYPDIVQFLHTRLYSYNLSQAEPLQSLLPEAPITKINPSLFDDYWTPFLSSNEVAFEDMLKNDVENKKIKYEEWLQSQQNIENPILSSLTSNKDISNNTNIYITIGIIIFVLVVYIVWKMFGWITSKGFKKAQNRMTTIGETTPLIVN